ncbi:PspA-associated protein PspAB, partial [Streptomyces globisporus]
MGLLDAILGRSKPVRPDLDQLFAVPSAALTLQAATGFTPTGRGSVCFAGVEGGGFARLQEDVRELLDADTERGGIPVEFSRDAYGYTWLLATHPADDTAGLVNDLHAERIDEVPAPPVAPGHVAYPETQVSRTDPL